MTELWGKDKLGTVFETQNGKILWAQSEIFWIFSDQKCSLAKSFYIVKLKWKEWNYESVSKILTRNACQLSKDTLISFKFQILLIKKDTLISILLACLQPGLHKYHLVTPVRTAAEEHCLQLISFKNNNSLKN